MKLNITPGPWSVSKGLVFILGHNNIPVCEETTPINDKWEHGDSTAIVTAVNNTYHKGINPEAVPELLQLVEEIYKSELLNPGVQNRLKLIIQKATL